MRMMLRDIDLCRRALQAGASASSINADITHVLVVLLLGAVASSLEDALG